MQPKGHKRRKEHSPDEEFQELAARSLREGVPVDELDLRLKNSDGSAGPDSKRVEELCAGAKEKLLAMAGYTTEKAQVVLKAAKEVGGITRAPGAKPEAAPQDPKKVLTADQRASLFATLKRLFTADHKRYKDMEWSAVQKSLEAAGDQAVYGLFQMEENGHEVDVTKVEKDGRRGFRFDSCSKESPTRIRNVDYFDAERIAESQWGAPLMPPEVFEELRLAGIIRNKNTWDYLKTKNPGTPRKPGFTWYGRDLGLDKDKANFHTHHGGFRCSLWVPEV